MATFTITTNWFDTAGTTYWVPAINSSDSDVPLVGAQFVAELVQDRHGSDLPEFKPHVQLSRTTLMNKRSIAFTWLPFDGQFILDEPGEHGIRHDGSPASTQLTVLITTDLSETNGDLDPESLLSLANRIESMQAGDPSPEHIMDGVDGYVFFSQGAVLIASSVDEDSALLIEPDELKRVLRSVHAVFAGGDFRNPGATFEDIVFSVMIEGNDAKEEYERRGGGYSAWEFDPKKCTFTYEGQPDDFVYPGPIPPGLQELCE